MTLKRIMDSGSLLLCGGEVVLEDVPCVSLFLGTLCNGVFSTLTRSGGDLWLFMSIETKGSPAMIFLATTAATARFPYLFVILLLMDGMPDWVDNPYLVIYD